MSLWCVIISDIQAVVASAPGRLYFIWTDRTGRFSEVLRWVNCDPLLSWCWVVRSNGSGSLQEDVVVIVVVTWFSDRSRNVAFSSSWLSSGSGTSTVAAGWRAVSLCSNWKNGGGGMSWLRLLRRVRLQQQQPHLSGSQCVFFSLGDIGIQHGHGPVGVLDCSVGWLVLWNASCASLKQRSHVFWTDTRTHTWQHDNRH